MFGFCRRVVCVAEPHSLDWREKPNCPRGGWNHWSGSGELGKLQPFNHSSTSFHLGTLCSADLGGFGKEVETGERRWWLWADGTIKLIQKNGEGAGVWCWGMRELHVKQTPPLHWDWAQLTEQMGRHYKLIYRGECAEANFCALFKQRSAAILRGFYYYYNPSEFRRINVLLNML